MEKRYAIIENGIVINITISIEDPSSMTDLLCIEVDDSVQINYIYDGEKFIQDESNNNNSADIIDQL